MRHTEDLEKGRRAAMEKLVRRIVQEEIVKAFEVMGRATAYEVYSTESEIQERALSAFENVAEGIVLRLTCPHERYRDWGSGRQPQCARCGEPEPKPEDPFKDPACDHTYDDSEGTPTDCIHCGNPYPGARKTDGTS